MFFALIGSLVGLLSLTGLLNRYLRHRRKKQYRVGRRRFHTKRMHQRRNELLVKQKDELSHLQELTDLLDQQQGLDQQAADAGWTDELQTEQRKLTQRIATLKGLLDRPI